MKKFLSLIILFGILLSGCSDDDDNQVNSVSTCDATGQVLSDTDYAAIDVTNYTVTNAQLNGNCLEVTVASSGCSGDSWVMNLYSTDSYYESLPPQKSVKVELLNYELCLAVFEKTVSFDVTPFQISGQNEVVFVIEGWDTPINYQY